ncbi:hypothetical protein D908_16749 [Vibrio mimicus CAIM 602]|nr:hypothetical protein D908_16749 [Vibrio mimicus CAIM 602]
MSVEHPTTLKHRGLLVFSDFETTELSTFSTKYSSGKPRKPNCAN